MTQGSESRQEAARPTPLLTPRTTTRVATWNIRTMYESGRAFQVAREMRNYKIGVLGLSETRWLQTGQPRLSSGEQLLYLGHIEVGAPHTEGVALMLAPEAGLPLLFCIVHISQNSLNHLKTEKCVLKLSTLFRSFSFVVDTINW